jgi:hypothetical protein
MGVVVRSPDEEDEVEEEPGPDTLPEPYRTADTSKRGKLEPE